MAAVLTLAGCSQKPVYSHFEHFDSNGWRRADAATYSIGVQEEGIYNIAMDLRVCSLYPYTQLMLVVQASNTSHLINRTDTVNIDITDYEGNPLGSGLSIRTHHIDLPPATLTTNDTLNVTVTHNMSRECLPGIIDIGIIAEK